ncbi:hypothetical protein BFP78_15225 [Gaetbulibacter sp. 5U11]|nr:hypothetical protein BFP78_15225 [Gaetbulibacter sp. 5U11]
MSDLCLLDANCCTNYIYHQNILNLFIDMKQTLLIAITILFSLSIFAQTPPDAVPEASQYHNSSKKYI